MREYVAIALKGAAMGVAEIIPGVSGGTIALITGIYDRLVTAIAALHPRPLRHLPALHRPNPRAAFVAELRAMDVHFLLALGVGMLAMVVTLARGIERLLAVYPGQTYAFFGGLIAASAIILYRQVRIDRPAHVGLAVVAIATAYVLSGIATETLGHGLPVLAGAGAIAIVALVLPGVSGSFLLLAMGQYEYMLGVLNRFVDALGGLLTGGSNPAELLEAGVPVGVFLAGAVVGLLTVAHAVRYALDRARQATLIVLISLMVGALRVPAEEVAIAAEVTPGYAATVTIAALGGVGVIYAFDALTGELEY